MNNNIIFEIGTEELPALELHNAIAQVKNLVCDQPGKHFDYGEINIYSTPRRIILNILNVPEKIEAKNEEFRGPKVEIAYKDGSPTPAAIGFAKGKGIDVEDLIQKNGYVYAVKSTPEKRVIDLLPDLFTRLIKDINWKKVQRWGNQCQEFARPIRWICAMFGSEVVNLEYAGVKSSNFSFGHRFLAPKKIVLNSADDLLPALSNAFVIYDTQNRQNLIIEQVHEIENKFNLVAQTPKSILQEVINLCEYPTCMVGEFDALFLSVPKEIIVDAMLMHQRYFPLFDKNGDLTNKFIIISNGNPECENTIVDGNQRVVAARLYDAKFFFDEDKKKPLESYVDKLDDVVFQEQLGNMKNKAYRISSISEKIAIEAKLDDKEIGQAKRAGLLAKADLVTGAVVEFTSVQGIMGSYYAKSSGEDDIVAQAIEQHYKPKFAGDSVPETLVGKCVAAADKIDTLCGMFAVGQTPTGSSDPFALRRGTIGLISIMRQGLNFPFLKVLDFCLDLYEQQGIKFNKNEVLEQVIDFVITRTKVLLKDCGVDHDTIDAVCSIKIAEPLVFIARANALNDARKKNFDVFANLATAFARANNLTDKNLGTQYNVSLFNDTEKELADSINQAQTNIKVALRDSSYENALSELAKLKNPIDKFFDNVMIMDKDQSIKDNRLKLLNSFVQVFSNIADFSKMAKTK